MSDEQLDKVVNMLSDMDLDANESGMRLRDTILIERIRREYPMGKMSNEQLDTLEKELDETELGLREAGKYLRNMLFDERLRRQQK